MIIRIDFLSVIVVMFHKRPFDCAQGDKIIKTKNVSNFETFQIYHLIFYYCMFFASMLNVACGTNFKRSLLISLPVTLQTP